MARKIIDTLLLLIGPVIQALSQIWNVFIPPGLEEALTSFLNLLLILFGSAVTLFVGVPAAIRLAPKTFARVFNKATGA